MISLYFKHDTYMGGMLSLLNFSWPLEQPQFGSAILFELRQDINKLSFVRVLYKNNKVNEPISINEVKLKGNSFSFFIFN